MISIKPAVIPLGGLHFFFVTKYDWMSFQLSSGDLHQTGEMFVTKKHFIRVRLLKLITVEFDEGLAAIRLCFMTKIKFCASAEQECTEVPAVS